MDTVSRGVWLKRSSLAIGLIGLGYILASFPGMTIVPDFLFDLVLWPLDGQQRIDTPMDRLMIATIGATILLVSYIFYSLVAKFHETHTEFVERLIVKGVSGWYVIEAVFSLVAGAPLNLILNAGFAALFLVPILLRDRSV